MISIQQQEFLQALGVSLYVPNELLPADDLLIEKSDHRLNHQGLLLRALMKTMIKKLVKTMK